MYYDNFLVPGQWTRQARDDTFVFHHLTFVYRVELVKILACETQQMTLLNLDVHNVGIIIIILFSLISKAHALFNHDRPFLCCNMDKTALGKQNNL